MAMLVAVLVEGGPSYRPREAGYCLKRRVVDASLRRGHILREEIVAIYRC